MDKLSTGAGQFYRCMALYGFLLASGDRWVRMEKVAHSLPCYYPEAKDGPEFHDTNGRVLLTNDIRTINQSKSFAKIIITGRKGIKLATENEAERYINRLYAAIFRKLKRARAIERKIRLNGQTTLDGDYIKAFLEEESYEQGYSFGPTCC